MSDSATLVERLLDMGETQRIQEASLKVEYRSETNIGLEAAARIAELEAEVTRLHEMFRDIGIGAVYGRDGWRPIDTAPMDGTVILLSDGVHFAAGARKFRIEADWRFLGYDEGLKYPNGQPKIGPRFDEKVPNPDAGKRHEWWDIHGCSAWSGDTDIEDDDGNCFFEPVYWMPVPARPAP